MMKYFVALLCSLLFTFASGYAQTGEVHDSLFPRLNQSLGANVAGDSLYYADLSQASTVGSGKITISRKKYYHNSYVAGLLFIGGVSLLLFFVLILFARSRDVIYLYYSLFLGLSLWGAYLNMSLYDWRTWRYLSSDIDIRKALETATLLALSAYCLFTLRLLEVKQQAPKLYRWILVLAGINAFYGLVYWLVFPSIPGQEHLLFVLSRSVILPMSLIAIVWVSYRIHSPFKSFFIIGSAFYFVGALIAVLRQETSAIPFKSFYNTSSTIYFHTGIFLEIVAFALALSQRIYLMNKARQKEQEKMKHQAIFERDQAMAEVLASRTQSNPHLIFNSLSAINYLIQSNQNAKAMKSLNHYSRFLRKILDTGQKPLITLTEELDIVQHYIGQTLIRYDRPFTYCIDVEPQIHTDSILVPPMLLMPFTEEIIWQQLSETAPTNEILRIRVTGSQQEVKIILQTGAEEADHDITLSQLTSYRGKNLIRDRIELFNKSNRSKIFSFIQDKQNPNDIPGKKYVVVIEE